MVEQELQFLPHVTVSGNDVGGNPQNQSQHARKAGVADDDEETQEQQREDGSLERDHRICRDGEAKVGESAGWSEEGPELVSGRTASRALDGTVPPRS